MIAHVDGVDPDVVRHNAERYRAQVEQLDATMRARFAAIPPERRKLVTNHHVFGYLAERYGFTAVGAVLPSGTTVSRTIPVIGAWEEPLEWQRPRPAIFVRGGTAYVSDPATRQIHAVDLASGAKKATATLPGTPNELTGVVA